MASMKSNRAKTSASEAPRRRDPERARLAILDAVTSEFSDHGFAGARVDRVALAAGLNKAMLYHYFGDKEALYLAVLERAYSDIREAENRLELSDAAPVEAVQRLVEFTWDYFVAHPEAIEERDRIAIAAGRDSRCGARARRSIRRLPERHRSSAALLVDRWPRLFLSIQSPYAEH